MVDTSVQRSEKRPLVCYTLPKTEMHVHISLALSNEVFLRRIKYNRTKIDSKFLVTPEKRYYKDLHNFHTTYEAMRNITRTPQEMANTTQDYLERIAKEGCIYAELSNSFRDEKVFEEQMEAIIAGIEAARYNAGIEARIMVTSIRDAGSEHAEKIAKYLAKNKSPYITGFGLSGDENINDFADFKQALHIAWHEAGLGLVPHVAEQHPRHALDFLNCVPEEALLYDPNDTRRLRVGHGTLIHMSSDIMREFAEKKICMEICLSANKRLGLPRQTHKLKLNETIVSADKTRSAVLNNPLAQYYNNIPNHPLPIFLDKNIPICLGSDNPLLMNTNIGKEYSLAVKAGVYDDFTILNFTKTGIKYANVDPVTRLRLLEQIDVYEQRMRQGPKPISTVLGYRRSRGLKETV